MTYSPQSKQQTWQTAPVLVQAQALLDTLGRVHAISRARSREPGRAAVDPCAWSCTHTLSAKYGEQHLEAQLERYSRTLASFADAYGPGPVLLVTAPARIELCGGHLDYIDYFQDKVLTFASSEYDMLMVARPRADQTVRGISLQPGFAPFEFSIADFPGGRSCHGGSAELVRSEWLSYLDYAGTPEPDWSNYLKGSGFYLQHLYPERQIRGIDLVVNSTIPPSGGASSSSALVMCSGYAFRALNGLPADPEEMATSGAQAEWYVGTRGGMMDHATMAFGKPDHAVRITFQPFSVAAVPTPADGYEWVTFYSHPTGVTPEILAKDNEISAVSCSILPLLIERALSDSPDLETPWRAFLRGVEREDADGIADLVLHCQPLLDSLPETLSLQELAEIVPGLRERVRRLYPSLAQIRGAEWPMPIRSKARYHLGEVQRVIEESRTLEQSTSGSDEGEVTASISRLGRLLDETHEGLRDLYGVSTDEVENLVGCVRSHPAVLGARVMGFGLGGNVLALVKSAAVGSVIEKAQTEYYRPRGRDGVADLHILVHTPGAGLGPVDPFAGARSTLIGLANHWENWRVNEPDILSLASGMLGIDGLADYTPTRPIKPLVLCGGKSTRFGGDRPKVLAEILGKPALEWVLEVLRSLPNSLPPLLLTSNEKSTCEQIRQQLDGRFEVGYLVDNDLLGTGHAVWLARERLADFDGITLVTEGTQAVLQRDTVLKSLLIHEAVGCAVMTMPTTAKDRPYAYLRRDDQGFVCDSCETRLEGAPPIERGEDNVSVYFMEGRELLPALEAARQRALDRSTGAYRLGQLGFPNEIVKSLVAAGRLVLGLCLAEEWEAQSLKTPSDCATVAQWVAPRNTRTPGQRSDWTEGSEG